jgi:flagellar protein FliS
MSTYAANAYRTVTTATADPVSLTTMLYDGALRSLKKARLFHEQRDLKRYGEECERSFLIVGELLTTLDLSQGELPKTLSGIYAYCLRCITAAAAGDVSKLDEVERHIGQIAGAWKTATESLRTQQQHAAEAVA